MATAIWNGKILAQSGDTEIVDGNHYFPANAIDDSCFQKSTHTTVCGWKGTANYYDLVVDGKTNVGAAWYYANPKPEAANIAGHIAFWKGVEVRA